MAVRLLLYYLGIVNVATFLLYGYDKRQALKNKRRIPEKVLHQWMFLGGSIGALVGQKMFRHKTAKGGFQVIFWILFMIQMGILIFLILFLKERLAL